MSRLEMGFFDTSTCQEVHHRSPPFTGVGIKIAVTHRCQSPPGNPSSMRKQDAALLSVQRA
jgi:hypothetical protein